MKQTMRQRKALAEANSKIRANKLEQTACKKSGGLVQWVISKLTRKDAK